MKKMVLTISFLTLLLGTGLNANAQEKTRIGAYATYASKSDIFGAGAKAEFFVTERFAVSPSLTYFIMPKDYELTWIDINANAHYYFVKENELGVYGLAGLNYSYYKDTYEDEYYEAESYGDFGLNVGAGINFNIGNVMPFVEVKYLVTDLSQLMIGAGVMFNL